ncbi:MULTISPECIES: hypothetical protein [unclassified Halomonas]|uniref:pilus assembly PilX family protein n=1 Tax=unclassified Halomonas TaxID=2609666 RepID=UPI0028870E8C|nr:MULTISPECIES: hypothetical protein [unclassified Halomonas]MDT0501735.1 hypothetical protein [Halomonas sp. PAR7]MDT0513435.1 hypothetical protein [Halomonas sp. LES1]MDT0591798.1 hypothetical protein [Halomonas sp. PAR8]
MRRHFNRQQGAALLVVLVMLVVVGLIAITGAEDAQLQSKMSINNRLREQAAYNAERLLINVENQLQGNLEDGTWGVPQSFGNGQVAGLYHPGPKGSDTAFDAVDGDWSKGVELSLSDDANYDYDYQSSGRWIIEYLGRAGAAPVNYKNAVNDQRPYTFRITVRGEAGGSATAIVQSEIRLEPN